MKSTIEKLINIVSVEENVNINDITNRRSKEAIRCRAVITYIMYYNYNITFKEIGKYLNHSEATISRIYHFYLTILSDNEKRYIKKIKRLLDEELALNS